MNVFIPHEVDKMSLGIDGHYTLSGEYHGRKFIIDDINPIELKRSHEFMLDDIARRAAIGTFRGVKYE